MSEGLKGEVPNWIGSQIPSLKSDQPKAGPITPVPICSACKRVRDKSGTWAQLLSPAVVSPSTRFREGICPDCIRKFFPDVDDPFD